MKASNLLTLFVMFLLMYSYFTPVKYQGSLHDNLHKAVESVSKGKANKTSEDFNSFVSSSNKDVRTVSYKKETVQQVQGCVKGSMCWH